MMPMQYKGFSGSVEYSEEAGVFYGKVLEVRGLISYEGNCVTELEQDFRNAVDEHLDFCERSGNDPFANELFHVRLHTPDGSIAFYKPHTP